MTGPAQGIPCPLCGQSMALRPARGRRSGKAFLMLLCPADGRHFRGFISDRSFVGQVLARLEAQGSPVRARGEAKGQAAPDRPSGADLEQGSAP